MKEGNGWHGKGFAILALLIFGIALLLAAGSGAAQEPDGDDGAPLTDAIPPADATPAGDAASESNTAGPQQSLATGPVLIVQDALPWGVSSIQNILTAHGISYDTIPSANLAATDLSPYEMVIMPSTQNSTYVGNWNANIGKIETYVNGGGRLWMSTSYVGAPPKTPGGVVSAEDRDNYNDINLTGHRWVRGVPATISGGLASEQSYTNLYPGSIVVASAQTSGRPVLVDYEFGDGRVLLTGQTLEYTWDAKWDGAPILENSLINMLGARVLLLQNNNAWGDGIQQVLAANNFGFNQTTSTHTAAVGLAPYDMVMIANNQSDAFNTELNDNIAKFASYVGGGGRLWHGTITFGSVTPKTVGGVVSNYDPGEPVNHAVAPDHPWLVGVPNPMNGTSASHAYFTSLYPGTKVVATDDNVPTRRPTLLDYKYGQGRVLLTGQTLTHAYLYNKDLKPALQNSIIDMVLTRVRASLPLIMHNVCRANYVTREVEPNEARATANKICIGLPVTGFPNDSGPPGAELDYYEFYWNGQGTLQVDLTGFVDDGQLILYHVDTEVAKHYDDVDPTVIDYQIIYNGAAGPGLYRVLANAGAARPTPGSDYTLLVTVH